MTSESSTDTLTLRRLGDIVKDDPRAAAVLSRHGLDFCCGGQQTLGEAAARRQAPVGPIVDALIALGQPADDDQLERRWQELDTLTRHIVVTHHAYVRDITPTLTAWLEKLVNRHGGSHPELVVARDTFARLSQDLAQHMIKEERVLFPYIDELAATARAGARLPAGPFGTILNPVRAMEEEHRAAGDRLSALRTMTSDFTPPADACATYRSCFAELEHFETDLKTHVHLENEVLFPAAIELEQRLM